jgi:hypothetical protein
MVNTRGSAFLSFLQGVTSLSAITFRWGAVMALTWALLGAKTKETAFLVLPYG